MVSYGYKQYMMVGVGADLMEYKPSHLPSCIRHRETDRQTDRQTLRQTSLYLGREVAVHNIT